MNEVFTDKYDQFFRKSAAEFFGDIEPEIDWRWFKAQAIAESGIDPLAMSQAGATGIMQLMPSTYAEMTEKLGYSPGNRMATMIYDPEVNIRCGIAYDRRCWNIWKVPQMPDRLWFMFASYNAGPGNIIKAQKLAVFKARWSSVSTQLRKVTGDDDAPETLNYVRRIQKIYGWEQP